MAISMSRRERTILIVTVALGLVAAVYHFGLSNVLSAFSDEREQLRQEKETYNGYIRDLKREPRVNADIRTLEGRYPMTEQRIKEFTASIEQAFKSFGVGDVPITPPEQEAIKGAEDYGFVTVRIQCDGDIQAVTRILDYFDRQAILIKELELRTTLDSPRIHVDAKVSQFVKLTEEMKSQESKKTGTSGSRVVRPREPMGL
jgi:hypothetical protein